MAKEMTKPKCPRCGKEDAIIDSTFGVLPGKVCQADDAKHNLADKPEFYTLSKSNRIQRQRDTGVKDLLQPFIGKGEPNVEFAKAYPDRVDDYFDREDLKKL